MNPTPPPLNQEAYFSWLDQEESRLQQISDLQMALSGLLYEAKVLFDELHTAHIEARDEIWDELQPIQTRIGQMLQSLAAIGDFVKVGDLD